ncbi:MAG: ATP-dependent Clp protease ATP-binding subunit [Alphaproteobacteria bacterium]|nr:ATP-dependent Clp protease ATP-binding subunit [Alphaproteobacteria bacterium]
MIDEQDNNRDSIKQLSIRAAYLFGLAFSNQMQSSQVNSLPYYILYLGMKDRVVQELGDNVVEAGQQYCAIIDQIEHNETWEELDINGSLEEHQRTIFQHATQSAELMGHKTIEPLDLIYGACKTIITANDGNIDHEIEKHVIPIYQTLNQKISQKIFPEHKNVEGRSMVTTSYSASNSDDAAENREAKNDSKLSKEDHETLTKYAAYMNEGPFPEFFGRSEELKQVQTILLQTRKNNPLLLGEAGVGKTAIVEGLVRLIEEDDIRYPFDEKPQVYSLDIAKLVAGTMYRGEFEARMKSILDIAERNKGKVVLFIDEIHKIVGAGAASSGMDAANLMKPAMARGNITIIGATTTDEYRKYVEKDKALIRRFGVVQVQQPDRESTLKMLQNSTQEMVKKHDVTYSTSAMEAAYDLGKRYFPEKTMPDSAFDLLDQAGAHSQFNMEDGAFITDEEIAQVVAERTGVPIAQLTNSDQKMAVDLEKNMKARVFQQDRAISTLATAAQSSFAGLREDGKTKGNFLFSGPTGVGKTEAAKVFAESLGIELQRFDMSEYMSQYSVSKLIGSPPGYVGYDQGGLLTEAIKNKPYSVILLDEVEKAHPDIFNIFLQVMDNGHITDGQGRPVDCRNIYLLMTTNAGQAQKKKSSIGFNAVADTETVPNAITQFFSPEFINRMDAVVEFEALGKDGIEEIAKKLLGIKAATLFENKGITLEFTKAAIDQVSTGGFDAAHGARPMKRYINDQIDPVVSKLILGGAARKGDTLLINFREATDDSKATFECNKLVKPANDRGPCALLTFQRTCEA